MNNQQINSNKSTIDIDYIIVSPNFLLQNAIENYFASCFTSINIENIDEKLTKDIVIKKIKSKINNLILQINHCDNNNNNDKSLIKIYKFTHLNFKNKSFLVNKISPKTTKIIEYLFAMLFLLNKINIMPNNSPKLFQENFVYFVAKYIDKQKDCDFICNKLKDEANIIIDKNYYNYEMKYKYNFYIKKIKYLNNIKNIIENDIYLSYDFAYNLIINHQTNILGIGNTHISIWK